ncbi:TetR/AcrR family transcriptional regulator [Actinoallomurus soli]|uniref:TetR/AcrR family transcriptional regulator n=1 Tax=Actinoallomurus soli TaxID=2952535 RepID=UPI002093C9BB|nr:TetR/AcrR family transcriptional regulator [Actinoallomurus soli]MCO5972306.1 TetR/AcrR family transcriptional regulator [Actinoallomurus soli]
MGSAADEVSPKAGYRRSAGSPRGEARRRELLERVTEDVAANGLVDFSLRRAARAAGTTHKVLLYHFDGVEDLLRQVIFKLRERRIDNALAAAREASGQETLAARIRVVWPTGASRWQAVTSSGSRRTIHGWRRRSRRCRSPTA